MSVDAGSNYNVAKTSTYFYGLHYEDVEPNEPLEENDPGRPPLRGGIKIQ